MPAQAQTLPQWLGNFAVLSHFMVVPFSQFYTNTVKTSAPMGMNKYFKVKRSTFGIVLVQLSKGS